LLTSKLRMMMSRGSLVKSRSGTGIFFMMYSHTTCPQQKSALKGLSHEIDFKKYGQKLTELDLTRLVLNFLWSPMIFKCKKFIYFG
jgi:hypothetical protein